MPKLEERLEKKLKSAQGWMKMRPLFKMVGARTEDSRCRLLNFLEMNPLIEKNTVKERGARITYKFRWKHRK